MMKYQQYLSAIGCLITTLLGTNLNTAVVNAQAVQSNVKGVLVTAINQQGRSVTFSCADTETVIRAKNGPSVGFTQASPPTSSTIYAGYSQVSSINKDPIMARFDNGKLTWCRTNYDTTGDDGTGFGLAWNGLDTLYGVFSVTGTAGTNDFRRYAQKGWLTSYGAGGGTKITVLARMNPANGDVHEATFISAYRASVQRTNSLLVTGLSFSGSNLVVKADSWWSPRKPDKTAMTCEGNSPFKYTLTFKPTQFAGDAKVYNLNTVTAASVAPVTKTVQQTTPTGTVTTTVTSKCS